ncbi:hypothetical protein BaRGS_00037458, partial [Batillaria attramentaria]
NITMASSSASHQSFTDCTHCKSLCLGPTILPCGHIICRKCLRQILEGLDPTCPSCGHGVPRDPGQTVSEVVDQLSKDLILEELVNEQLAQKGDFRCIACPSRIAEKVCLDCGDAFCDSCSWSHCDSKRPDVHVLQDLPMNFDTSQTTTPANSRPGSLNPRKAARDLKETLKTETGLLKAKVSQVKKAVRTVSDVIADLQEVKDGLHQKEELLTTYTIGLSSVPDARAIFPRLERVRADCAPPPSTALKELKRRAKTLAADQYIGGSDQTWPSIILTGQSRFEAARRTSEWSVLSHATAQMDFSSEESDATDSDEFFAPDVAELSEVPFPQHHVEVVIRKERTPSEGESSSAVPGEAKPKRMTKTERLVAIPHSTTINMPDVGLVGVQEILDTAIQHAVENVLIAKIDWGNNSGSFQLSDKETKRWSGHLNPEAKQDGPQQEENSQTESPATDNKETTEGDAQLLNGEHADAPMEQEEDRENVEREDAQQEKDTDRHEDEKEDTHPDGNVQEELQANKQADITAPQTDTTTSQTDTTTSQTDTTTPQTDTTTPQIDTTAPQINGGLDSQENQQEDDGVDQQDIARAIEQALDADGDRNEDRETETAREETNGEQDMDDDVEIDQDMYRVQIRLKEAAEVKANEKPGFEDQAEGQETDQEQKREGEEEINQEKTHEEEQTAQEHAKTGEEDHEKAQEQEQEPREDPGKEQSEREHQMETDEAAEREHEKGEQQEQKEGTEQETQQDVEVHEEKDKEERQETQKVLDKELTKEPPHKPENTINFIVRPEKKKPKLVGEVVKQMGEGVLPRVVERLFEEFHVRLLGVDCGLNFLMETPVAQWAAVLERQEEVQQILGELFPSNTVDSWAEVKQCSPTYGGWHTRIGQPLPVQMLPRNGPVEERKGGVISGHQLSDGEPSLTEDIGPVAESTPRRTHREAETVGETNTQQEEATEGRKETHSAHETINRYDIPDSAPDLKNDSSPREDVTPEQGKGDVYAEEQTSQSEQVSEVQQEGLQEGATNMPAVQQESIPKEFTKQHEEIRAAEDTAKDKETSPRHETTLEEAHAEGESLSTEKAGLQQKTTLPEETSAENVSSLRSQEDMNHQAEPSPNEDTSQSKGISPSEGVNENADKGTEVETTSTGETGPRDKVTLTEEGGSKEESGLAEETGPEDETTPEESPKEETRTTEETGPKEEITTTEEATPTAGEVSINTTNQHEESTPFTAEKTAPHEDVYPESDTDSEDGATPTEYTFVDDHDGPGRETGFDRHLTPWGRHSQVPLKEDASHTVKTIFHRQIIPDEESTQVESTTTREEAVRGEGTISTVNGPRESSTEIETGVTIISPKADMDAEDTSHNESSSKDSEATAESKQKEPTSQEQAGPTENVNGLNTSTEEETTSEQIRPSETGPGDTVPDRKLGNGQPRWNSSKDKGSKELFPKETISREAKPDMTAEVDRNPNETSENETKPKDHPKNKIQPKEARPQEINRQELSRNQFSPNGRNPGEMSPKMMSRREAVQAQNSPKILPWSRERNTPREINVRGVNHPRKERLSGHFSRQNRERVLFNPMTATPKRTFLTRPDGDKDSHKDGPGIMAVVTSKDCRYVMTDFRNKTVKISDPSNPAKFYSVKLDAKPLTLATLNNDTVAVTTL